MDYDYDRKHRLTERHSGRAFPQPLYWPAARRDAVALPRFAHFLFRQRDAIGAAARASRPRPRPRRRRRPRIVKSRTRTRTRTKKPRKGRAFPQLLARSAFQLAAFSFQLSAFQLFSSAPQGTGLNGAKLRGYGLLNLNPNLNLNLPV
jgi:hypothetical protein